jgi:type I restriction enzyme S subunit
MTLRNDWREVRIGDLGDVLTGRTPPTDQQDLFGSEFPFITPGDMRQGRYARETQRCLSTEGAMLLQRIRVPANSVCVSCIGWQMGEVIMTDKPSFTNQQINTIVPNQRVDPKFLYYTLRPRKQELLSFGSSTGVRTPILNKSSFSNLKVALPPLPIQRRIGVTLGAYDDLIEVNRRRIALLEELTRRLFEEWFVHFRFPSHEDHGVVEVDGSKLPFGWIKRRLDTLCDLISRGISPTYDDNASGLVISQKCIRDGKLSLKQARHQSKPVPGPKLVRPGDILVNSTGTGTLGRVAQVVEVPEYTTTDSHVTIIRAGGRLRTEYLGAAVGRIQPLFESMAVGATNQMELNKSRIEAIELVVPTENILAKFASFSTAQRALVHKFQTANDVLERSRDLLLPRLVSGELQISAAEVELEAAA